jgi:hypothetical protein
MLDIHAGDVVRQQHNLITMQLLGILLRQARALDLLHDARDEVARPVSGSRMCTPSSDSDLQNSERSTSSTLRTMKSKIGCGV